MRKARIYCWHPWKSTGRTILEAMFGLGLAGAFWYYRIYAAMFVMGAALLLLRLYQLRFVVVSGEGVSQLHWCRIDCRIPLKELVRMDTRAEGRDVMVCLYGEQDILELPYRSKTLEGILGALGVEEEVRKRLLASSGEDFRLDSGGYRVLRETVFLDALFGKKAFVHREVCQKSCAPAPFQKTCSIEGD